MKIHQSMCIQWPIMHILTMLGQWPQMTPRWSWLHFCWDWNWIEIACFFCTILTCLFITYMYRVSQKFRSLLVALYIQNYNAWYKIWNIFRKKKLHCESLFYIFLLECHENPSKYMRIVSNFSRANIFDTQYTHTPTHTQ